jgi:BlaI family transcriptional regulator, penicillinase repressor
MESPVSPTERELEILKILWRRGEATVRQVYEEMQASSAIVQNTVQAFLRTMEDKGLVTHRVQGRSFVYSPIHRREQTSRHMVNKLLDRVYDGAIDQLVASLLSVRKPTDEELRRLQELVDSAKSRSGNPSNKEGQGHDPDD